MAKCNTQANDMATTANNWPTPGASDLGRYNVPPLVPYRFHLGVRRSIERGLGWVHANDTRRNVQMTHAGGWTRLEGGMIDGKEGWRGMRNKQRRMIILERLK